MVTTDRANIFFLRDGSKCWPVVSVAKLLGLFSFQHYNLWSNIVYYLENGRLMEGLLNERFDCIRKATAYHSLGLQGVFLVSLFNF